MFSFLSRFFSASVLKQAPAVRGFVTVETRERGKRKQLFHGENIWTLTGREFLVELMSLTSRSPRTAVRSDRISYLGVGSGSQAEVATVSSLVEPIPYAVGEFLAPLAVPNTFGTSDGVTSVSFSRTFGYEEISLGYTVVVTEYGLFTDGDPDDNWSPGDAPTDYATAAGRAPMAYKAGEPVSKTSDRTMQVTWEIRVL